MVRARGVRGGSNAGGDDDICTLVQIDARREAGRRVWASGAACYMASICQTNAPCHCGFPLGRTGY